jgi:hypothetical protein
MASWSTWSYVCIGCLVLNVNMQPSEEPALNTAGFFLSFGLGFAVCQPEGVLAFWVVMGRGQWMRNTVSARAGELSDLAPLEYCFGVASKALCGDDTFG